MSARCSRDRLSLVHDEDAVDDDAVDVAIGRLDKVSCTPVILENSLVASRRDISFK